MGGAVLGGQGHKVVLSGRCSEDRHTAVASDARDILSVVFMRHDDPSVGARASSGEIRTAAKCRA